MSIRDFVFMFAAFFGIIGGLGFPFLADILEGYPRISLMIMLFLCFLGLDTRELLRNTIMLRKELLILLVSKLILVPAVVFFVLYLLMPQYALGVLLMAGAPAGVVSAVFAQVVRANFTLALAGTVLTSLVSPFTLPILSSLALGFLESDPTMMADFSPLQMSKEMALLITVPFTLAQIVNTFLAPVTRVLLRVRFWINAGTLCLCNIAIFAAYAPTLTKHTSLLLSGLGAAMLAWVLFFSCGAIIAYKWSLPKQLSMGLSIGITNSVLAMILGIQFFSLNEILPGAMFAVPTMLALVPCRLLIRLRTGKYALSSS